MSLLATILAAAEAGSKQVAEAAGEQEKSETPFFLIGGALVSFAIIISVIGFRKPDFPAGPGAARGVMALGGALVLATMATVVYVSS